MWWLRTLDNTINSKMDKLKDLSVKLDGKIKSQNLFNANVEDTSFRSLTVKDYRQYKIIIDEYRNLYSMGINVNSDLSFSINRPDRIFLYKIPKYLPDLPYTIYVSDETFSFVKNSYLENFWNSLGILLKKLELSAFECVFVYNNYVYFYLTAQRDLVPILDDMVDLINTNEKIFRRESKKNISSKGIPENLKQLIPFLKKYSISDDADRTNLIEEMDRSEKLKLINSVQPLFDEIRIYLDSFNKMALSEEAILIEELAELVSELKLKE